MKKDLESVQSNCDREHRNETEDLYRTQRENDGDLKRKKIHYSECSKIKDSGYEQKCI